MILILIFPNVALPKIYPVEHVDRFMVLQHLVKSKLAIQSRILVFKYTLEHAKAKFCFYHMKELAIVIQSNTYIVAVNSSENLMV